MEVMERVGKAALVEATKPETFVKGEIFEAYVREHLFPKDKYRLL